MVVDFVLGVSQGELHLAHQKAFAKSEVNEDVSCAFVQFVLDSYYFEIVPPFIDLFVYSEDLLSTAHAPASHNVHHIESHQVD